MKKIFPFILFSVIFFCCTKKSSKAIVPTKEKDSLEVYLAQANNFELPVQKQQKYIEKAFRIIAPQHNDSIHRVNLFKIANRYYNIQNWKGYKSTVLLILKKSVAENDFYSAAKGHDYLGDYYNTIGQVDSSFLYYYNAEKLYRELKDYHKQALVILKKANLQFNENDLLAAEKATFRALQIVKNTGYNDVMYDAYNLLGMIYNELEDFETSMIYHNKAIVSIDKTVLNAIPQPEATSYNNIGNLNLKRGNYKAAKQYLKKGLNQKDIATENPEMYATLLNNFALAKLKLKEKEGLNDLFYQSLKIREDLQITAGIISSKINLSEYYISKKDELTAIKFAREALYLSKKSKDYRNILNALKQLSIIDPKNASFYGITYIQTSEQLQKSERKMGNKFTRIEYETDEIKSENNELAQQNRNLLYLFSGLGVLGLLIFKIKSQKAKNRELLFKQQQQVANEEIYNLMISQQNTIEISRVEEKKRVARELHDGVLGRMFGVRMNLDGLNKQQDESAMLQRINYLAELKNIEQDIREISHDLNREKSELINNFVAIVNNLFEEQKKTYKSKFIVNLDHSISWEKISNTVKINLYRIIQEILQNTNKYAEALHVKVDLKKEEDHLVLKISDDGKGFNLKTAKKGIGLQNILFRANECEGVVDIKSAKQQGTIVTVTLPIA